MHAKGGLFTSTANIQDLFSSIIHYDFDIIYIIDNFNKYLRLDDNQTTNNNYNRRVFLIKLKKLIT